MNPVFEELLDEVRLEHEIEVIHGGHVSHADPYATRVGKKTLATPGDPLALLLAHVKKSSLRLMDFFAQLDKDNSMSVTRTEFKKGMKVRSCLKAKIGSSATPHIHPHLTDVIT